MTAVLAAVGASHRYRSRRGVAGGVSRVDLEVGEGRAVGLVGPSGSGKSTVLGMLLGRLPAQEGTVCWRGAPLVPTSVRRQRPMRRDVQLVPQDPASSLDPRLDVATLVGDPLRRLRVPGDHARLVAAALEAVGLHRALLRRRPAELSGGQAQRVAVARALATGARVLIADEPVSGLDPSLRDQVLSTFEHLVVAHGVGLLLVSHDLDAVARTCPDLVVLAPSGPGGPGVVVEHGPTERLLRRPAHPTTAALVAAQVRLPGRPGPSPAPRTDGETPCPAPC